MSCTFLSKILPPQVRKKPSTTNISGPHKRITSKHLVKSQHYIVKSLLSLGKTDIDTSRFFNHLRKDQTTYRYRYGKRRGGDLGIHIHGDGDEDRHRNGHGNVLPLHTVVHVCRCKSTRLEKLKKIKVLSRRAKHPVAALTCLQVLALHVGLAVGGLGQREWLAQHRLVLDVPHQGGAGIRRSTLVHQLNSAAEGQLLDQFGKQGQLQ